MENVTEFSVAITVHNNDALKGSYSVQVTMPYGPDAFFVSNYNGDEEDICFNLVSDNSENIHRLGLFSGIMKLILEEIDRECDKLKE